MIDKSKLVVRKANLEDVDILNEFQQALITYERAITKSLKNSYFEYYNISELIANDMATLLVATLEDKIIASGYARIKKSEPYEKHELYGYLGFIYVSPEYRGNGIVEMVIQQLIDWVTRNGIHEIQLEVYAANESAIRAYSKLGFKPEKLNMRLIAE